MFNVRYKIYYFVPIKLIELNLRLTGDSKVVMVVSQFWLINFYLNNYVLDNQYLQYLQLHILLCDLIAANWREQHFSLNILNIKLSCIYNQQLIHFMEIIVTFCTIICTPIRYLDAVPQFSSILCHWSKESKKIPTYYFTVLKNVRGIRMRRLFCDRWQVF